ncbi:MAG: cell envelope integrity protein TolA [Chromatiaceae bacterium]|jgi:colicin import membrane protein
MEPAFKKALQISASLHLALLLAMFINFSFFDKHEVIEVPLYSASNAPLQASVVENPNLKEADKPTRKKPEPKKEPPKPEPKPEPEEDPQEELQKQEEERKIQEQKEIQVKKKQEEAKKKKEEADIALKKKKEKEKLDKQKKEEERKKELAEKKKKEELAKKKKEEDLKKKKEAEAKKKAEALKKKKAEEKKRKQELDKIADEMMQEDELAEEADEARRAARQGQLLTEKQRYVAMIVERVRQSWFTDDTMNGKECVIELKLASNGFVTSLNVVGGDAGVCNAAVNAINRVGRFPMPEDPELNQQFRELKLPFKK